MQQIRESLTGITANGHDEYSKRNKKNDTLIAYEDYEYPHFEEEKSVIIDEGVNIYY